MDGMGRWVELKFEATLLPIWLIFLLTMGSPVAILRMIQEFMVALAVMESTSVVIIRKH